MKKIYTIISILILVIQVVAGIQVDFSMNDLDLSTQYDVDNSVYVYEEASANPLPTTISDYRDVQGNGKINLKQGFSSTNYAASSGVKADSGSVQSTALLTSTDLSVTQRANLAGSLAESFLAGYQGYMGGMAFTGQYLGVQDGILSTVQTLSLGRSIYSTQDFQASGINPLAIGYALVASHGINSFDAQGAFIVAGACREGSISGSMGAEVVKVPDATAIDPIAYGSKIDAQGNEGAGIIAGAGALKGDWSQNPLVNYLELEGQGALAGTVGIGENSRASVDYIQAQTDGQESSAFEDDAKAKGDDAAIVAAGAGNFNRNAGFRFGPNSFLAADLFDMQGAIAAAAAVGDDSRAKASWIGAITDGTATSAGGERLKAKADGFAGVGAGAGSLYMDRGLIQSPFFFFGFDSLGVQGALTAAMAGGDDSRASAKSVDAFTDGDTTFAEGYRMRASGDDFAGVGAGAGSFYMDRGLKQSPFFFAAFERLGLQGALTAAVAGGDDSRASADFIGALTDGDTTLAEGYRMRASGDDFAGVGAGAGNLYMGHGQVQSPLFFADFGSLDMQGALTAAVAGGEHSRASADFVGALTDGDTTLAEGHRIRASGDDFAGVGAGAGNLYMGHGQVQSPLFFADFGSLDMQGALTAAVAGGDDSRASADFVGALTDGDTTLAEGHRIRASGDDFAGVGAGAGSLYMDRREMQSPFFFTGFESLDMQGALTAAVAGGDDSRASAGYVGATTDGDASSAQGFLMRAKGDDFAGVGAGAGSIHMSQGMLLSPFFSGIFDSLGAQGALAVAAAGGDDSQASAGYVGALNDGDTASAEGLGMQASGNEFAATGAGVVSIRKEDINTNPATSYDYEDTQGSIVADVGMGEDSSASAGYVRAETDGDRTAAIGVNMAASGKTSAHAVAGAGEGISLDNGVLKIYHGSATGFSALENGAVGAALMSAETGYVTQTYGIGAQATGDKSALAYTASGDKLTVWADSVRVKDGTLAGLAAKGAMSHVQAGALSSSWTNSLSTSQGSDLLSQGEGAIAATGSGGVINFGADAAKVDSGSMTGAAAYGDASVTSVGLGSLWSPMSTLSIGDMLVANGGKSAALATGKGEKVTLKADEDEGRAKVEHGTIAGVTAYKNARVSGVELVSGDIDLNAGPILMDGEGSFGQGLIGSGDKSASLATGSGDSVVVVADEDKGRAKADQGSVVGVTAFKNALVAGGLLASGKTQVAVGAQMVDVKGSTGLGLIGLGEKSASIASGAGDSVVIDADKNRGMAKVEDGTLTGVTAHRNALVAGGLLASGDLQLNVGPFALNGLGSIGTGLTGSGEDSASGASGFGEEVFTKANSQMGEAKVTNGGIVGMAAHEGGQVGADLMGSAGLTGGTASGWIGLNPSATGTMTALGTGFGSEVNIEADAAVVETTTGSIIGATASGQNSRTSAGSIGGYEIAAVPTLEAENVLAQGESASAGSAASLISATIASDKITANTGSVTGMAAKGGQVQADTLGFSNLLPSGTNLKASGTSASMASAASPLSTATIESNKISVNAGTVVGMAAQGAGAQVEASSLGFSSGLPSGSGIKASGATASAASATGVSTVIESNKISVNAGSVVGMVSAGGLVQADNLGSSNLLPSGTNLKASGTTASAASATSLSPIPTAIAIESNKITVNAGSVVGMAAEGAGAQVEASSLGFSSGLPSGSGIKASGATASAASATGVSTVIESNKISANAGSVVGMVSAGGLVQADNLGSSNLLPSGTNLKASGTSASMASAASPLSTATIESNKISVNAGTVVGMAAQGAGAQVEASSLGFSSGLPSGSGIKASGATASAASATGVSTVIESNKISANAGSVVGMVSAGGLVQADNLGSSNLLPSGTNLKASGTTASAASATSLSPIPTAIAIESNKITVNAGSVVGMAAQGAGAQVEASSLGFSSGLPSGSGIKASGATASAASATSALSTATIESNKVSVNSGSVVGMVAAGGQVGASTLGFNGIYPSGTTIAASGTSATAASATGLGTTTLESNKVTVNTGSMVGLAVENGQVTAGSLRYDGTSSIGSGLAASGSKSMAAAGAGNKITMQPDSIKIESTTLDPNGVLIALAAGGNSQIIADNLEASKGLTSVAKGYGTLSASGQDYSEIAAASSGYALGGTIIDFQPSSGTNPYYGMTIPWGAYGGARTSGGTVSATTLLMAKALPASYVIGGPNAGPSNSNKDYTTIQATGTQQVVFAAYKGASSSPSVTTNTDGLAHQIWAFKTTALGNKVVN